MFLFAYRRTADRRLNYKAMIERTIDGKNASLFHLFSSSTLINRIELFLDIQGIIVSVLSFVEDERINH